MNKLIVMDIIEELFTKYLNSKLDLDSIENALTNKKESVLSDDMIVKKENEFIAFLFANIPYYKIISELDNFYMQIEDLTEETNNSQIKGIRRLIMGYLVDLKNNIKERIKTEIHYHLLIMAKNFDNNYINADMHLQQILRNFCNPKELLSLDISENVYYEQLTLFNIQNKKVDMREEISKQNFTKKSHIEKRLIKFLSFNFTKESYQSFISFVRDILELSFSYLNMNDANNLLRIYENELMLLHRKIHVNLKSKIDIDNEKNNEIKKWQNLLIKKV